MENLKIRVANSSESKEAQKLFFELGFAWNCGGTKVVRYLNMPYLYAYSISKDMTFGSAGSNSNFINNPNKEITLPQLRDLVVLKRNHVGDATHTDGYYSFYVGKDKNYFFSSCDKAWRGTWKNVDILKPIEKPMKEYLRKNNDGEYILEVTDEREAQEPHAKHWIEVPKGCDYLISVFGVNSFIDSDMFAKFKTKNVLWSRKPMKEYLNKETYAYVKTHDLVSKDSNWIEIPEGAEIYLDPSCNVYGFYKDNFKQVWCETEWEDTVHNSANLQIWKNMPVLWQRHTLPEELPFIDDESSLGNSKIGRRAITVKIPVESLNDQYAEIETVRQSAWQKQEGGSHYKNLKIQPMQYALENKLDYAQANVVKYVTRHADKNGKEDLLKAIHNIELMIEFYYGDEK